MTEPREQYDEGICTIPPDGWWCSRTPGHDGPCAARPLEEPDDAPLSAADEELINQAWEKHKAAAPSAWQEVGCVLPEVGREVLLHWPVPDMPPILRIGKMLYKPFPGDNPLWKLELDYGDAGAWVFVNRDDEQPTHWMPLPPPPASDANPASSSIAGEGV